LSINRDFGNWVNFPRSSECIKRPAIDDFSPAVNSPMRCCEPRDLVERARDVCRFHRRPFELTDDTMELAWRGYFGAGSDDEPGV